MDFVGLAAAVGWTRADSGWRLSFDWHLEEGSGLWNVAFLAKGAEIMVLFSEKGPVPPLSLSLSPNLKGSDCAVTLLKVFDVGNAFNRLRGKLEGMFYLCLSVGHLKS